MSSKLSSQILTSPTYTYRGREIVQPFRSHTHTHVKVAHMILSITTQYHRVIVIATRPMSGHSQSGYMYSSLLLLYLPRGISGIYFSTKWISFVPTSLDCSHTRLVISHSPNRTQSHTDSVICQQIHTFNQTHMCAWMTANNVLLIHTTHTHMFHLARQNRPSVRCVRALDVVVVRGGNLSDYFIEHSVS